MNKWNYKFKPFWTIWAIGWYRTVSFQGKTIELKIFAGPVVLTMWR